jgi:molybdenum cofactor guanylyltransferase
MPSAAILVGGQAQRYGGRDKSALVVAGTPILQRQIAELGTLSDDILLVGRHGDHDVRSNMSGAAAARGPLAALAGRVTIRTVDDRVPNCGPLGGLDAALSAARHEALVLLACDMPLVSARLLAHMLELARDADLVVPRTERGYHPLCAVYTRACREPVQRLLGEHRLAMVGLFDEVHVRVVEREEIHRFGSPEELLANVNTPAEFDELEALLGHKP